MKAELLITQLLAELRRLQELTLTATSADINGGSIDGTAIGVNSVSTGNFSSLSISGTDIFGKIYPVGSVYISTVSTNPGTLFGIGTWVSIGSGRVLQRKTSFRRNQVVKMPVALLKQFQCQ